MVHEDVDVSTNGQLPQDQPAPARDLSQNTFGRQRPNLSAETRQAIAELYRSGEALSEIRRAFEVSENTVYRILHDYDVPLRGYRTPEPRLTPHHRPAAELAELAANATLPTSRVAPPDPQTGASVTVTVDPALHVEPQPDGVYRWRVTYSGSLVVQARTIEDALQRTRQSAIGDSVEITGVERLPGKL